MSIAFVQQAVSADANGSVASVSVTITAGTTGNLICGMVTFANTQTLTSVKDNNGVTYNIVDTINDTANGQSAASFYKENISGAPTSIIATFSAADTFTRIEVQEWSGIATVSPLDGHNGQADASTPLTTATFTTTADGNLIYGAVVNDGASGSTFSAGSGFTLRNQGSGAGVTNCIADESQIQSIASASTVATFGITVGSGTRNSIVFGMAFKAAVSTAAVPMLSRPILFRPFRLAPFLNRFPPGGTNPAPQLPSPVAGKLDFPIRFRPFVKAPWLNRLPTIPPPFNSGNVTSLPGFGSLSLTGLPPSLAARVFSGFGSITLNGQAPSLRAAVAPGFGSLVLTGRAPNLAFVDHPGFGSIILTGFAPTASITSGQTVLPGIGQILLTGLAPSLAEKIFPTNGAILLTGKAPILRTAVPAGFGSIVLTGKAPFLAALPGTGAVLLIGRPPTVSQSGGGGTVFQAISSLPGFFNPNASAIP